MLKKHQDYREEEKCGPAEARDRTPGMSRGRVHSRRIPVSSQKSHARRPPQQAKPYPAITKSSSGVVSGSKQQSAVKVKTTESMSREK
jgi:hypothetical protein